MKDIHYSTRVGRYQIDTFCPDPAGANATVTSTHPRIRGYDEYWTVVKDTEDTSGAPATGYYYDVEEDDEVLISHKRFVAEYAAKPGGATIRMSASRPSPTKVAWLFLG